MSYPVQHNLSFCAFFVHSFNFIAPSVKFITWLYEAPLKNNTHNYRTPHHPMIVVGRFLIYDSLSPVFHPTLIPLLDSSCKISNYPKTYPIYYTRFRTCDNKIGSHRPNPDTVKTKTKIIPWIFRWRSPRFFSQVSVLDLTTNAVW